VDKMDSRSKNDLPSSNVPTITSWRFSHRMTETLGHLENVIYPSSSRRRDNEDDSSRFVNGKPHEKSQWTAEMDENRRPSPAKCETNGEEVESNDRRFRNPGKDGVALDIYGGGSSSDNSGV